MKARYAREIRQGILLAKLDVEIALSPGVTPGSFTQRIRLTAGAISSRLARRAYFEYSRRRLERLGANQ